VHGQLTATYLADLARRHAGADLASFSFRARRALIAGSPFFIDGKADGSGLRLWATDADGGVAMDVAAELDGTSRSRP
jgi:hydroxyacyl-ACP dehydratase HTD2-like protein with hotdog domain